MPNIRLVNGTGALDDVDLTMLRRAAAMAHIVGGLTLRVRSGGPAGRLAATVVPSTGCPTAVTHPSGVVLDPCGFRMAVFKAWSDHRAGRAVSVAGDSADDRTGDGAGDGGGVDVEWSLDAPGRLLGFGGLRTSCADRMVWALPSLLSTAELADTLAGVDDGVDPMSSLLESVEARLVRDDLLEVTVVYVEVDRATSAALAPLLDEVVRRLVAASTASELVASLAAA
jgi:hypothetical protein